MFASPEGGLPDGPCCMAQGAAICEPCGYDVHEACQGCHACGCARSAASADAIHGSVAALARLASGPLHGTPRYPSTQAGASLDAFDPYVTDYLRRH